MERKPEKFRLRLNLFDSIVLILALAVGAYLLWNALKPAPAVPDDAGPAEASTIRYTVILRRCVPGTSEAVALDSRLTDSIRNYDIGRVKAVQAIPTQELLVDQTNRRWVLSTVEDYEDLLLTVEAPGTVTDSAVTLSSGYIMRVGSAAYIQGDGFLGSGSIYAIERED